MKTADVEAECAIAGQIGGERVADFGSSDCGCESHLVYREERDVLVDAVEQAHRDARE